MFFEQLSAQFRTLRFRLMLWNATAVILTGIAVLVTLREGVRFALQAELDQVLTQDLQEISLYFSEEKQELNWQRLEEELDRKARGHEFQGWFVQFFDARGLTAWSSSGTPGGLNLISIAASGRKRTSRDGYRIVFLDLPGADPRGKQVCVGSSQAFITRDMARLDRLTLLVGGIVLVLSPLGGYLLAGRATRPLAEIIQTTASLRPSELSERLPLRDAGDELDHLAITINGLLDRIADYLQEKHDFLANAAHELRTPLAAIRSSVEVALSKGRSSAEYEELLAEMIEECASLESLVNQLLLLAESDADRLRVSAERTSLSDVVKTAIDMFQPVAEFRGLRIESYSLTPCTVIGNRLHLRQVMNNLLDNAIKFTAARYDDETNENRGSGVVRVSLFVNEEKGLAEVVVSDNGIGIPEKHLPHIFERFYRVDRKRSRGSSVGGTGLGLCICAAIINAHHGEISATSRDNEGTTFRFTIPIAKPLSSIAAAPATAVNS